MGRLRDWWEERQERKDAIARDREEHLAYESDEERIASEGNVEARNADLRAARFDGSNSMDDVDRLGDPL
jgi:hypothetical protein